MDHAREEMKTRPQYRTPVTEEDIEGAIQFAREAHTDIGNAKIHIYLSGPMSGYENFNFDTFESATLWLRSRGYTVFSPHEQGWGDGDPSKGETAEEEYLEFLAEDIRQVTVCDRIVLLPGWENSRGAQTELDVARKLKKDVWYMQATEIDGRPDWLLMAWNPVKPETILQEADRLVATDRQDVYGHPIDDFAKVTGMALALWGRGPQTEEEHALYMVLVKLARLQSSPDHRDSMVDVAGYIKTYAMVREERPRREGW